MRHTPYSHAPLSARIGRLFLGLVCSAGALAGCFLLLCALGILSPGEISQQVSTWLSPQQEESTPAAGPAEISVPEEEDTPFQAVFLPLEDLDSAPTLAAGYDGVVLPMKTADGALGYVSALSLAADIGASSGDPNRNEALRALNDTEGLYTVAQVSCLRDTALVQADPSLALHRVSGSAWLDSDRQGWLDPTQAQVQDYLTGVCQELARLGFDEILLTDCAFPTQGDLDSLGKYPQKEKALETFCRQLQGALADYDVTLSVVGLGDSVTAEPVSGQTTGLLATFGRVWAAQEDAGTLAAFEPVVWPVGE